MAREVLNTVMQSVISQKMLKKETENMEETEQLDEGLIALEMDWEWFDEVPAKTQSVIQDKSMKKLWEILD